MIFIDTSLIVAFANEADEFHKRAVEIVREIDSGKYGTPVLTDYIFDETITTLLAFCMRNLLFLCIYNYFVQVILDTGMRPRSPSTLL